MRGMMRAASLRKITSRFLNSILGSRSQILGISSSRSSMSISRISAIVRRAGSVGEVFSIVSDFGFHLRDQTVLLMQR